jgi:hypothetical protein
MQNITNGREALPLLGFAFLEMENGHTYGHTLSGLLLDGRNRLRACYEVGQEIRIFTVHGNPVDAVISANVRRRHQSKAELAFVAYEALPLYAEEAKRKQEVAAIQGNKNRHMQTKSPVVVNLSQPAIDDLDDYQDDVIVASRTRQCSRACGKFSTSSCNAQLATLTCSKVREPLRLGHLKNQQAPLPRLTSALPPVTNDEGHDFLKTCPVGTAKTARRVFLHFLQWQG